MEKVFHVSSTRIEAGPWNGQRGSCGSWITGTASQQAKSKKYVMIEN